MPEIIEVPLDQLSVSKLNVRRAVNGGARSLTAVF